MTQDFHLEQLRVQILLQFLNVLRNMKVGGGSQWPGRQVEERDESDHVKENLRQREAPSAGPSSLCAFGDLLILRFTLLVHPGSLSVQVPHPVHT